MGGARIKFPKNYPILLYTNLDLTLPYLSSTEFANKETHCDQGNARWRPSSPSYSPKSYKEKGDQHSPSNYRTKGTVLLSKAI